MDFAFRRKRLTGYAAVIGLALVALSCNRSLKTDESAESPTRLGVGSVVRLDRAFNAVATDSAQIEKLLGGYGLTDGPFYSRDGYLLFSDVTRNTIYKWTPDGAIVEFRKPAGFDGKAQPGALIGPRAITIDGTGQTVVCEAGNRRITTTTRIGDVKVLIDKVGGRRLNSPQDVVFASEGVYYFTDPPFGLAGQDNDPAKEIKVNGVYRVAEGTAKLVTGELSRPSGIAITRDDKYLFVSNADASHPVVMRYELRKDGSVEASSVFFDFSSIKEQGVPAGIKLDLSGHVYVAGPGGIYVLSDAGKHLGTFKMPTQPTNLFWGKYADTTTAPAMASAEYATTLYMTGGGEVYRIALTAVGLRP